MFSPSLDLVTAYSWGIPYGKLTPRPPWSGISPGLRSESCPSFFGRSMSTTSPSTTIRTGPVPVGSCDGWLRN
eukprot:3717245-Rhodomonas_salina.3